MSKHQLIVTILGTDNTGILSEIATTVSEAQCNILDSRQAIYGKEFSLTMIIEGTQSAITKAECFLPALFQRLNLLSMMKRTSHHEKQNLAHLFNVEFSGEDAAGIRHILNREVNTPLAQFPVNVPRTTRLCLSQLFASTLPGRCMGSVVCNQFLLCWEKTHLPWFSFRQKSIRGSHCIHSRESQSA